jgi:molecular chaperone GrpE
VTSAPGRRCRRTRRRRILLRFESWLDDVLQAESLPEGVAAEFLEALDREVDDSGQGEPDLYTLFGALTALTQEVKLQGRAFKELSDAIGSRFDLETLSGEVRRLREDMVLQLRQAQRETRPDTPGDTLRGTQRELVEALLDVRDRLSRGLESIRPHLARLRQERAKRWWRRFLSGWRRPVDLLVEAGSAQEDGYRLVRARLGDAMDRLGLREIECLGEPFDPRTMKVIDIDPTGDRPEGTVVDVYRPGYSSNGELLRAAQVKVSRSSTATGEPGGSPSPRSGRL